MTPPPPLVAEVLAECEAKGVRLLPTADGGLEVDATPDALTEPLLERLRRSKSELLTWLQKLETTTPCHRCGATTWSDTPIHGGRSVRRDCARCGRFVDFPVWYGR